MRISDWSSDVCSSDLLGRLLPRAGNGHEAAFALDEQVVGLFALVRAAQAVAGDVAHDQARMPGMQGVERQAQAVGGAGEIGRASCRARGCQYVSSSGVAAILTKKKSVHQQLYPP